MEQFMSTLEDTAMELLCTQSAFAAGLVVGATTAAVTKNALALPVGFVGGFAWKLIACDGLLPRVQEWLMGKTTQPLTPTDLRHTLSVIKLHTNARSDLEAKQLLTLARRYFSDKHAMKTASKKSASMRVCADRILDPYRNLKS